MPLGLPPSGLSKLVLPLHYLDGHLYRIHRAGHGPIHFGRSGLYRFDDPAKRFGVLYAGLSSEAAFSETFLRNPPKQIISEAEIALRRISKIKSAKTLQLVQLYDHGLARTGVTAEIGTCEYDVSQAWSAALHQHPDQVDGIIWRGRHDNGTLCVAIYDRAEAKLSKHIDQQVIDDVLLQSFANRWGFGLVP